MVCDRQAYLSDHAGMKTIINISITIQHNYRQNNSILCYIFCKITILIFNKVVTQLLHFLLIDVHCPTVLIIKNAVKAVFEFCVGSAQRR